MAMHLVADPLLSRQLLGAELILITIPQVGRNPGEDNVEPPAKPLERFSKKELIVLVRQLIGDEQ